MSGKTPEETMVTMTELVLPTDVNLLNNLKGGRLMHLIDIAAALAATKHANTYVATVSVDNLTFNHPIRLGEMVELRAKLVYCGKTSMHVSVSVYAENLYTKSRILTNKAHLVFVALDKNEKPTLVPPLIPITDKEKADYVLAQEKANNFKKSKKVPLV